MANLITSKAGIVKRLWTCDSGTVVSTELVLMTVVAVIGLIVAMTAMRDSVVSELVDSSLAVQNSNQTISYNGASSASASTAGSNYLDALDRNDGEDIAGAVVGMEFDVLPEDEATLEDLLEERSFTFEMNRQGRTWTGSASFSNGRFNASPFWPGNYSVNGSIITVVFDALGFGWNEGTMQLDASNLDNPSGNLTWVNSFFGVVWEATYQLFAN